MPYLTAHALDRANEVLVRWRLSGRLSPPGGPSVVQQLAALEGAVHPAPESLDPLEPVAGAGRSWRAVSPWPGASGMNRRWVAERCVASPGEVRQGSAPTLILLHGWLNDRPQQLIYRNWARAAARRGIDVWMPRLPHHLERTSPGDISGQRCLSADLGASLDAVRQAVAETRALAAWLRRRGASSVGIWGMSLGGWVASLAATLDDDWDAVVLWAPVASPAEVLFESRLVDFLRSAIVAGGMSQGDFTGPEIASMTPESRRAKIPRAKVMIVSGVWDRVVSPRSIVRLARRWNVDVRWQPHGHISLMASRAPVRDTTAFLEQALR